AIFLSLIPHDMQYGPQAALIAESFKGRVRYSGASLGYQLSSVIAGGPAPLVAAWLFSKYHSAYAIAGYIAACSVVTLIATSLMTDKIESTRLNSSHVSISYAVFCLKKKNKPSLDDTTD